MHHIIYHAHLVIIVLLKALCGYVPNVESTELLAVIDPLCRVLFVSESFHERSIQRNCNKHTMQPPELVLDRSKVTEVNS